MVEVRGLEDVIAADSSICYIDGARGILSYRGIDIHELAEKSSFEEVCFLLWEGRLPRAGELSQIREAIGRERALPAETLELLERFSGRSAPMDALRTVVSSLSATDPDARDMSPAGNRRKAVRLTGQIATAVAAFHRLRQGKNAVPPDPGRTHADDFLRMLNGETARSSAVRAMDIALVLHADHELNASTFAARVTAATLSDMHSAITSAIGALKGPLHGGANEAVFHILEAIDASGADPVEYVKGMLAQKKKIPGFGHRVYHTEDPRATHLRAMSRDLGNSSGQGKWFEISHKIEEFVKA